jgi:hypothetical protein
VIRVDFDPHSLEDPAQKAWWAEWNRKSDTGTDKIIEAFEDWLEQKTPDPFTFGFTSKIWKELKDWLLKNVFYRKCAYCEREISGYYGDAEHYRPKGAVKRKTVAGDFEEPVCEILDPANRSILKKPHPGYFWLAYDWRNLVPSCVYCNSGQGKNERFDIGKDYVVLVELKPAEVDALPALSRPRQSKRWPGYYYLAPAGLDELESPYLLTPLNAPAERNPRKHLRFGVRGTVAAVDESPLGRASIEVFQLKDEDLRAARQRAQETFGDKFYDAMRRFDPQNPSESGAKALLREYETGHWPFSAAALDYHKILSKAQAGLADSD